MPQLFVLFISLVCVYVPAAIAQDCWLSVDGAGGRNGKDRQNAYGVADGNPSRTAQKCWEQTGADGTMYVLNGNYASDEGTFWQLTIDSSNSGDPSRQTFKKLRGIGEVRLQGSRPVPYSQAQAGAGGTWIRLGPDARYVSIENFAVHRVAGGILATEGGNSRLRFENLSFSDTRQNIVIDGHPDCVSMQECPVNGESISNSIVIAKTIGIRYSKRHIRLGKGISDVDVVDSHADAQDLDGDFAVGFDVENPASDITFTDSSARRNRFTGEDYVNGDGFKAEDETRNIQWIGCSASHNGDAGFDIKTEHAVLENIVARHNTRNIRIWHSAKLKHVDASFSNDHGGKTSQAGIWSSGTFECDACTLVNNAVQVHLENNLDAGRALLRDSDLVFTGGFQGEMSRLEENTQLISTNTRMLRANAARNQHTASQAPLHRNLN